jgi:hypothetical protein
MRCSQGCYAVKIWLLDLWPWKSIGSQTLLRTMHVPILVKIHWRMLILECSQGCYAVKIWPGDHDPCNILVNTLESTSFNGFWPYLVHTLSLGESGTLLIFNVKGQCHHRFQILLRTKYVPSLVKIHWRMLIIECSQECYGSPEGSVTISLRNFVGEGIII